MIPVTAVRIGEEEKRLVMEVLDSGMLAQGRLVEQLENRVAAIHGVRHAVAVNNGTTALIASMKVLDLQPR